MKHQLLHLIFFASASFTNAQTIPKSIDKLLTVKPAKPITKPVVKQNAKKEYADDVDQKEKFDELIPGSYSYMGSPHEGLSVVSLKNHPQNIQMLTLFRDSIGGSLLLSKKYITLTFCDVI